MRDVTRILLVIEQGGCEAAEQLLPLVYGELRRIAAQKLAHETPGNALEATAVLSPANGATARVEPTGGLPGRKAKRPAVAIRWRLVPAGLGHGFSGKIAGAARDRLPGSVKRFTPSAVSVARMPQ